LGLLAGGSEPPPHQLGVLGSAVSSHRGSGARPGNLDFDAHRVLKINGQS